MVDDQFHYGAIIKLQCTPNAGHEQGGWRPAIIVSNDYFNSTTNLKLVCPITHTERNYPYHIKVEGCKKTDGYIMCEQIRAVDLKARNAEFVEDAPSKLIAEVNTLAKMCL